MKKKTNNQIETQLNKPLNPPGDSPVLAGEAVWILFVLEEEADFFKRDPFVTRGFGVVTVTSRDDVVTSRDEVVMSRVG